MRKINNTVKLLAVVEMKLLLRTKRTKNILAGTVLGQASAMLLLLSLKETQQNETNVSSLMITLVVGAAGILGYAQYGFAWQGKNLILYFARQVPVHLLLKSRFVFLGTFSMLSAIAPTAASVILFRHATTAMIASGFIYSTGAILLLNCVYWRFIKNNINLNAEGFTANWDGQNYIQLIVSVIYTVPLLLILSAGIYFHLNVYWIALAVSLTGITSAAAAYISIKKTRQTDEAKYQLLQQYQ